jgi:hypothetical protein
MALPSHSDVHRQLDSLKETRKTSSTQLLIQCPLFCNQVVDLETIKLASDGNRKTVWNCPTCRKIKKKQIKINWYDIVCVECSHRNDRKCLIQSCASDCLIKQAIEKRRKLNVVATKTKEKPMTPIADDAHRKLCERLKVLKTAWILGNGSVPRPWFKDTASKKVLLERLHCGLEDFAAKPTVTLPIGLKEAIMAKNFDVGSCMKKFGFDWAKAREKLKFRKFGLPQSMHTKSVAGNKVFKYRCAFYQEVNNFCNNHNGLKKSSSKARKQVVNTNFPKTAYLVIPGHSCYNYRHIPENWKNGTQDLSKLKGTAYFLSHRKKPTGTHLLLVCHKELKMAAASALVSTNSHSSRKRPAKVLDTDMKQ